MALECLWVASPGTPECQVPMGNGMTIRSRPWRAWGCHKRTAWWVSSSRTPIMLLWQWHPSQTPVWIREVTVSQQGTPTCILLGLVRTGAKPLGITLFCHPSSFHDIYSITGLQHSRWLSPLCIIAMWCHSFHIQPVWLASTTSWSHIQLRSGSSVDWLVCTQVHGW